MHIPFFTAVTAGFPSPADDYIEQRIDLNKELIRHPSATFFIRVQGESMQDAGILSGDILIVDRAIPPKSGNIIIARLEESFTVKYFLQKQGHTFLKAANPRYKTIEIFPDDEFEIWGTVTYIIHPARNDRSR